MQFIAASALALATLVMAAPLDNECRRYSIENSPDAMTAREVAQDDWIFLPVSRSRAGMPGVAASSIAHSAVHAFDGIVNGAAQAATRMADGAAEAFDGVVNGAAQAATGVADGTAHAFDGVVNGAAGFAVGKADGTASAARGFM
ncbi:hypothetical protein BDN71DRAFT_1428883 [Pleurotus eryngii]|uniref:Uncharacterized protein n=1 Tax=Pleurotus eryngii TaxID=5323 RepID=A0A9P6A284_PLEER|nr:hypothetical protein BDN71DRAFT_1428883 [Pleurotus eryngii]